MGNKATYPTCVLFLETFHGFLDPGFIRGTLGMKWERSRDGTPVEHKTLIHSCSSRGNSEPPIHHLGRQEETGEP